MTCSYKFCGNFILCTVRCIFFSTNVISTLSGLTYKNIEKVTNKIFNVPDHLKQQADLDATNGTETEPDSSQMDIHD